MTAAGAAITAPSGGAVSERRQTTAIDIERHALLEAEAGDLHHVLRAALALQEARSGERILETLLGAVTSGSVLGFDRALLFWLDPREDVLQGRLGAERRAPAGGEGCDPSQGRRGRAPDAATDPPAGPGGLAARSGPLTQTARKLRYPVVEGRSVVVDAVLRSETIAVADAAGDNRVDPALRDLLRSPALAVAPIRSSGRALGAVLVDNAPSGRALAPRSVEILSLLAALAGRALEAARLEGMIEQQTAEVGALRDAAREILGASHLDRVLTTIARAAAQNPRMRRCAVWLSDPASGALRAAATHGLPAGAASALSAMEGAARRAIAERRVLGEDADARTGASTPGSRVVIAAPLIAREDVLGALTADGHAPGGGPASGAPDTDDAAFAEALAAAAALAVSAADSSRRARGSEKALRDARAELVRAERLAALGELSAKVARQIRGPLVSLGELVLDVERALPAGDPNRARLALVAREADRLRLLLDEQLRFARPEEPRLRMESLNRIVGDAIAAQRERVGEKGMRLTERLAPELPLLLLDAEKVLHVATNILAHAVESVPAGGRVQVETRLDGGHVEFAVAHEGTSPPGDVAERLFVPFAVQGGGGGGIGLAISTQIVREHGGEIRVMVREPWSAIYAVRFPVRDNLDRRRAADRRAGRDRRRT
jgi:signal transduction histidine kinase